MKKNHTLTLVLLIIIILLLGSNIFLTISNNDHLVQNFNKRYIIQTDTVFKFANLKNRGTTKPLGYYDAKKWHEDFIQLTGGLATQGYVIEKEFLDNLFKTNKDTTDILYAFLGKDPKTQKITLIFSEAIDTIKTDANGKPQMGPDGKYERDTIVSKTLLYEYVRPCPSFCPVFK